MHTPRNWHASAEGLLLPVMALAAALLLFGVFCWFGGQSPTEVWGLLFRGAFGDAFSWQNTLQRAAPLMLTALCVALPARAGLIIIGGEGAVVLGGLAAAALPYAIPLPGNVVGTAMLCLAGMAVGAAWIALAGALRQYRGVNETISSLLLAYTAIALFKQLVEGPLRDPKTLNKPSTRSLVETLQIGGIAGSDVHWGLVLGVVACVGLGLWLAFTPGGFAVRVVGGNPRTAQLVGLPASGLILLACALGGGCAGLAGAIEVAGRTGYVTLDMSPGYGYTGIVIAMLAGLHPLGVIAAGVFVAGVLVGADTMSRAVGVPTYIADVIVAASLIAVLVATLLTQYRVRMK